MFSFLKRNLFITLVLFANNSLQDKVEVKRQMKMRAAEDICSDPNPKPFPIQNWDPSIEMGLAKNINTIFFLPKTCIVDENSEACQLQYEKIKIKQSDKELKRKIDILKNEVTRIIVKISKRIDNRLISIFDKKIEKINVKIKNGDISKKEGDKRYATYRQKAAKLKTELLNNALITLYAKLANYYQVGTCAESAAHDALLLAENGYTDIVSQSHQLGNNQVHTFLTVDNYWCDHYNNRTYMHTSTQGSIYSFFNVENRSSYYHYKSIDLSNYPKSLRKMAKRYNYYKNPDNLLKDFPPLYDNESACKADDEQCRPN